MTAMPLTTMSYDVANRMVESIHQTAGTTRYGYNHANQRVMRYTSATGGYGGYQRRFALYGFGGELLLEANFEAGCISGCPTPPEKEVVRYVYFLGRKMFASVNRGPLKAAVPNRLGSRSDHFPYGELKGAAPPDGDKDNFTTYRRDETGLDYAWNRYYVPSVGRFTTADPYGGSIRRGDAQTWNRYTYARNNPIRFIDPKGLSECDTSNADACIDVYDDFEDVITCPVPIAAGELYEGQQLICNDGVIMRPIVQVLTPEEAAMRMDGILQLNAEIESCSFSMYLSMECDDYAGRSHSVASLFARTAGRYVYAAWWASAGVIGKVGEHLVRTRALNDLPKNTRTITMFTRDRIPDFYRETVSGLPGFIAEVKNVAQLRWTLQLQDYARYARDQGWSFYVYVRSDTVLSPAVQEAERLGFVIIEQIPFI